ncbi:MAG: hypothetical protein GY842_06395, partial [bacterium]|nr:hypothetical protein [bacterium]
MAAPDWLGSIVAIGGPAVSILGAVASATFAFLTLSLNKQVRRAEAHRGINSLYDKLMDYRTSNPKVLGLSRGWRREYFTSIYEQKTGQDREWAIYYTYVELCLGFCNVVLYNWHQRLLDRQAYEDHFKPLIKLIMTEHHPILRDLLRDGKY